MTTEPQTTQAAPMQTGGQVMAIVPQTFPEIQRIAITIINAGIAPAALVKFAKAEDDEAAIQEIGKRNVAAVATCIMAGAELGLPPMVSLRAFTVINGKPALYADGNVAVVRKAKTPEGKHIAEYIKTGYAEVRDLICPVCKEHFADADKAFSHMLLASDEAHSKAEAKLTKANIHYVKAFTLSDPTDKSHAWCEGKRFDNGEIFRESFSIEDAKRAGLWDDKPHKRAKVWRNGKQDWHDDVPNDAVWFRYPRRMMMWRAVGYCLRWLFADVLGGMSDEYEAREIEGMVDVTPATVQAPRQIERPTPPMPPTDDDEDQQQDGAENEGAVDFDFDAYMAGVESALAKATTADEVEEAFDKLDVQPELSAIEDDGAALAEAFRIKAVHLARVEKSNIDGAA